MRALILALFAATASSAQTPARHLFGAESAPSTQSPAPLGSYARGCLAGGVELAETGPRWQAMRLSRNRNWGHPEIIRFVERLSAVAVQNGWAGLYVGDISQPRGGPMLTGHRSHQIGLDADIWMYAPRRLTLSRADREAISSVNVVSGNGRTLNSNWTRAHYNIIRAAAEDPAVARIFVNPAIKLGMCNMTPERGEAARWLGKVRPWFGHNYHFHVRLACPAGSPGCVNQDPPPPHDDCATALTWFQPPDPNAPAAPSRPRRELTLADLPQQCASVLSSG